MTSQPETVPQATLRAFIDGLGQVAAALPDGLDSPIELGICDRKGLQLINSVEVDTLRNDGVSSALIIAHWHPGEVPGEKLRGWTEVADSELQALTTDQPG